MNAQDINDLLKERGIPAGQNGGLFEADGLKVLIEDGVASAMDRAGNEALYKGIEPLASMLDRYTVHDVIPDNFLEGETES